MIHTLFLGLFVLTLASACTSNGSATETHASWVWIQTGPEDANVLGDERNAAFAGHFANMRSLSEEGELLVAGPLGESKARPGHRGVFILPTADPAKARAIADTDPTARAGVFQFEIEPFATEDPIKRLPDWHAAALDAAEIAEPPPGFHCRSYLLAEGSPFSLASSFANAPGVLFAGRLGEDDNQRLLVCLDAEEVEQAPSWLADDPRVNWDLTPWYGTEEIVRLRKDIP